MCPAVQESRDCYAFHFLQDVAVPVVQLIGIGRERRCSADYHWENARRDPCHLIQYTLSGHGIVRVGSNLYRTEPGSAFLLSFPGDNAYYYDPETDEPWEFLFLLFTGDASVPYLDYIRERCAPVFPLPMQHPAAQKLLELHAQARAGQLQDAFIASSQVFSVLCALCSPCSDQSHTPSPLISAAIASMRGNFARGTGVADVCAALGVSQSHLSRAFVKETGVQPILYLTRLRLEEAVRLLNTTDLSISEISSRCGFDTGNYFSKVFRRHMGVSPSAFRQRLHRQEYASVQL